MTVQVFKDNLSSLSNSELKNVVLICMNILEDRASSKDQTQHSFKKNSQGPSAETKTKSNANQDVNQNEKENTESIEQEFEYLDHPVQSPSVTPQIISEKKDQEYSSLSSTSSLSSSSSPIPVLPSDENQKPNKNLIHNNPSSVNIISIDFSLLNSVQESALDLKLKCDKLINNIEKESFDTNENENENENENIKNIKSIDEIKTSKDANVIYFHSDFDPRSHPCTHSYPCTYSYPHHHRFSHRFSNLSQFPHQFPSPPPPAPFPPPHDDNHHHHGHKSNLFIPPPPPPPPPPFFNCPFSRDLFSNGATFNKDFLNDEKLNNDDTEGNYKWSFPFSGPGPNPDSYRYRSPCGHCHNHHPSKKHQKSRH
ncbi:uncharacterized protein ASCRUDRAFT_77370 [Ascoidea rubescens DSM 1968]|uniref:Uncharacterized protein n=1 Tax=Ascoidea rubescens DSM 1968 TaxID=1344418 RepID=A0A1D2VBE1_9ASCO|nr:hypothetical protein ASCRUDRAFT_77370 [Ascoidea rubescens DSM 1968]ODV58929.1 hypothetical protein ASCRUDRAFT_77370 [Ascoidea rubescens DSM 1968]